MSDFYVFVVGLLFVLAISDLIVGVSNDAVNFLNSAIGSNVTSRRNIMIVASLGILVGATFSSGMMEVARKGIFNPDYFYFSEIMVVFIAVMITDIILLDLFNTFGMPTSTTVSIVFELLGAAVAVSLLKIASQEESLATLDNYINYSSALLIISGIFLSIIIAFSIGSVVQYISRLIFTFNVSKNMAWINYLWCGLALSSLTYFLFIKGISGASFISEGLIANVQKNALVTFGFAVVIWTCIVVFLHKAFQINILKVVVLFGTFTLAMSFSGNDLVNFIGVPIAGYESYLAWSASGVPAESYAMGILLEPIQSKSYMLLLAGLIMTVTLWFSKKARAVTETEVNLGRQSEGDERFNPNILSKRIVRYSILLGKKVNDAIPETWLEKTEKRFQTSQELYDNTKGKPLPAFDLVRASVNLAVASILIAYATSLKLPLSTTYVSFMVAMGTSLSDKAWGRNSAVFRIAGVINVIGGWFVTAILAFTASAAFAIFIYFFDIKAIGILILLVVFLISRTFLLHKKKEKEKKAREQFQRSRTSILFADSINQTSAKVASSLLVVREAYESALNGLLDEDLNLLKTSLKRVNSIKKEQTQLKYQLFDLIKRLDNKPTQSGRLYVFVYDLVQDMVQSISLISETCLEHVSRSLTPVNNYYGTDILKLRNDINNYFEILAELIKNQNFANLNELMTRKKEILESIELILAERINDIRNNDLNMRNSMLLFTILLESKDLVAISSRFAKLYSRIKPLSQSKGNYFLSKKNDG
ncbi:anion permease [uncultured Winogradskyella sp.]|uniref:inorganic phosphate transporter n=1 Tax=uncultured Winogradskyella sp. TaxID=395353 RepID=UPI0035128516